MIHSDSRLEQFRRDIGHIPARPSLVDHPSASSDELKAAIYTMKFGDSVASPEIINANFFSSIGAQALNACLLPENDVKGVLSIDKDEIWMLTKQTLNLLYLTEEEGIVRPEHNAGQSHPWYDVAFYNHIAKRDFGGKVFSELDAADQAEVTIIAANMTDHFIAQLTSAGKLVPDAGVSTLVSYLDKWQEAGVYNFINTATCEGTELGTAEDINKHLGWGAIQGLVFMRNHSGDPNGMTKARVSFGLAKAIRNIQPGKTREDVFIGGVDDGVWHATQISALPNSFAVVQPYPWNVHVKQSDNLVRPSEPGAVAAFAELDKIISTKLDLPIGA